MSYAIAAPLTGDFDDQIIPQSSDYAAGFAVYIKLYVINIPYVENEENVK